MQPSTSTKKTLFLIMGRPNDFRFNKLFNLCLTSLVFLNLVSVTLESMPSMMEKYGKALSTFDHFSIFIFSIEYILRVWTCNIDPQYQRKYGRIKYMFSPMAIIDLLSILPSLIPFFITDLDLRTLRVLRLFRLIRLFKFTRYSLAIKQLQENLRKKAPELVITTSMGISLLFISSSLMYFIEHEVQPEKFSSIPATTWWAISTLTTVGYGDVYPITPMGQFIGGISAFLGIGLFVMPSAIIASSFIDEIEKKKELNHILTHAKNNEKDLKNLPPNSENPPDKKIA